MFIALAVSVLLLGLAAAQVFAVSAALYFADLQEASIENPENTWLDTAELLSISNPDVFVARAKFLRQKALLPELKDQRAEILNKTLSNLARAVEQRPLWPYYRLSEFNILVLQGVESTVVQSKVSEIISLAPNERGLDKHFLELAFHSWERLSLEQQQWMLKRLSIVPRGTLNYVFSVAKKLNKHTVICTSLPYKKIKRLCKAR
jgi:hypothetical protein